MVPSLENLVTILRLMPDVQRVVGAKRWDDEFPYESATFAEWVERATDPDAIRKLVRNAHRRFETNEWGMDLRRTHPHLVPVADQGHWITHYFDRKWQGYPPDQLLTHQERVDLDYWGP